MMDDIYRAENQRYVAPSQTTVIFDSGKVDAYTLAKFPVRAAAFTVDFLIYISLMFLVGIFFKLKFSVMAGSIMLVILCSTMVIFQISPMQASIGQHLFDLKLVNIEGEPIHITDALLRFLMVVSLLALPAIALNVEDARILFLVSLIFFYKIVIKEDTRIIDSASQSFVVHG